MLTGFVLGASAVAAFALLSLWLLAATAQLGQLRERVRLLEQVRDLQYHLNQALLKAVGAHGQRRAEFDTLIAELERVRSRTVIKGPQRPQ